MSQLGAIAILVVLSAVFSGTETSFTSISLIQKKELEQSRKKSAKIALELVNNPSTLLTTTLIGNNIVNIGASSLATQFAIETFGNAAVGIATGLLTLIILIFGEITPKQLAMSYNLQIATFMARPVKVLTIVLFPLVVFFRGISNLVTRMLCRGERKGMDMQGLLNIIAVANESGVVDDTETEMAQKVFTLSETRIVSIMTPWYEVFTLSGESTVEESSEEFVESGFSRIPIYQDSDNRDRIVGVVLVRDLLKAMASGKTDKKLKDIAVEACFVPELISARKMFTLMKEKQIQFAVALNEYGETSGIVTMEDIIEELVGDIYDEHEMAEPEDIVVLDEKKGLYRVQADCSFRNFTNALKMYVEDSDRISTVASYVLLHSDAIPGIGDAIDTSIGIFTVLEMEGMRAVSFEFERMQESE